MQTVKQILQNGTVRLFETDDVVTFRPGNSVKKAMLTFDSTARSAIELTEGMIYVMNDMGKTVDKYDLNGSARPTESAA